MTIFLAMTIAILSKAIITASDYCYLSYYSNHPLFNGTVAYFDMKKIRHVNFLIHIHQSSVSLQSPTRETFPLKFSENAGGPIAITATSLNFFSY
jgi:hypothetical protein